MNYLTEKKNFKRDITNFTIVHSLYFEKLIFPIFFIYYVFTLKNFLKFINGNVSFMMTKKIKTFSNYVFPKITVF